MTPVTVPYEYSPYMASILCLLVLQILAVFGRVYVRVYLVKGFGKDDVACILTLILACAFDCIVIAIWRISNLLPLWDVPMTNIIPVINMVLATELLYILATTLLKVALALLLLRVLVRRWMQWVIYVTASIPVTFGIVYFFIVMFQCGNPVDFPRRIVLGQCLTLAQIDGWSYAHAVLTATADLVFGIMPVIFLWDAAFSRRAKVSVGAILALGSAGCICTFIRIGWIHYLTAATGTYLVTAKGIVLLSSIELSCGLICISLATYRPLISKLMHRRCPLQYHPTTHNDHDLHNMEVRDIEPPGVYLPAFEATDELKMWQAQSPSTETASIESYDPWRVAIHV